MAKHFLKFILSIIFALCSLQINAAKATYIPHFASFIKSIEPVVIHIQNGAIASGCPENDFEFIATIDGGTDYDELGTPHTYLSNAVLTTNCDINLTIKSTIQDSNSNDIPLPKFVKGKTISFISLSQGNAGPWKYVSNMDTSLKRFKGENTVTANSLSIISKATDLSTFAEGKSNALASNVKHGSAACTNNRDCWSGVCSGGTCSAVTLGYLGDACTKNTDCASSSCVSGACSISTPHQKCADNADCVTGICTSGTCVTAPPLGGPGDPCTTSADCQFSCYGASYCLGASGTFAGGEYCTAHYDCQSNSCQGNLCDEPPQSCTFDHDCQAADCIDGLCVPW